MTHYGKFYVDGSWVDPIGTGTFTLVDPTTEEPFGTVRLGDAVDVDRAVLAARRALPGFASRSKQERSALLLRIADALQARQSEFMATLAQEMGAPVSLTGQVGAGVAALRQAAKTLEHYEFETRMGDSLVRREPIGVAGLITPWNWPVQMICNKLSSALAAGCTVVLKPSEFTPVSALLLAEVLHDAGVPSGVFNLVNGDGPTVGNAISAHDDVDIVSFTGSTRAGILVAEAAARSVKRVTQELGGKSANIVLPDADLKAAAEYNVSRGFSNTGQSCHSPTRLLVHQDQLDEMLRHLRAAASQVRVGDPKDPSTTMGPVVNRAQYERIQRYIQVGIDEGGEAVIGGTGRPDGLERGFFIRPTIIAGVTPEMTVAREEIFGPVTAVMTYRDEEEAIQVANGTQYGLGAYVFGGEDHQRLMRVARRFRAGRVFVNGAPSNTVAPMGGYKKSGNGREMGVFGLEEYLEVQALIGAA